MYTPQGIKKTGPLKRMVHSVRKVCREMTGSGRPGPRGRRNGSLAAHQRTWKLKMLSRGVAYCVLVLVLLVSGGFLSYGLLSRSDIFRITDLIVQGNSMATEQQILEKAGLKRGLNLLTLDLRQVESLIMEHPWVNRATIRRLWPSTVEITVGENKPLALVNIEREGRKQLYYVNRTGALFAPSTPSRDLDFPVLTGESLGSDVRKMQVTSDSLTAMAIEFLNLASQGNQILPSQAVSEVHVSPAKGLVVYLVDHPFPIYMGKEKIRTRFNLLVRVLAQLYRQDKVKEVAEIRMDYAEDKILVANIGARTET